MNEKHISAIGLKKANTNAAKILLDGNLPIVENIIIASVL